MRFQNTETPTFAGAGGLKPAVVEALELKDREGNVLAVFTKAVDGSFSLVVEGTVTAENLVDTDLDALDELTEPDVADVLLILDKTAAVAAVGTYAFDSNPVEDDTISFNRVEFVFKDSAVEDNEIEIGTGATGSDTDLGITIFNLLAVLNASIDPLISAATYTDDHTSTNKDGEEVTITHDTAGAAGNDYTLDTDTAEIIRSAATLEDGADATAVLKKITLGNLAEAVDTILNP